MNFNKLTDQDLLATEKILNANLKIVDDRLSDNKRHSPFEVTVLCNIKASYEIDLCKIREEKAKRKLQAVVMGENNNEDTRF